MRFCWRNVGTLVVFRKSNICPLDLSVWTRELITTSSWWDETKDAGKFSASKMFSDRLAFGGDGVGPNNCVIDGPYANLTVNIGKGFLTQPRCVNRKITDIFSTNCSAAAVEIAISGNTYDEAWLGMYMGPHLFGHIALAMMVNLVYS